MAKKETLEKIAIDLQTGQKQKAVMRLRSLITSYPYDLSLREKLAEIYYEAGFLDMAGLYWLLHEPSDERMSKAIEVYRASVNYSEQKMLADIAFHGEVDELNDYATNLLIQLKHPTQQITKKQTEKTTNNVGSWIEKYGCLVILTFCLFVFIWGMVDLAMTLFPWLTQKIIP